MTAKANNFGDLNSVKKEVERIYSQIGSLEKEKTKWDKMGDKKRVQYYTELIKDNEHKIKTFQKVISDVEKMTAKKTTKKTSSKKTSAKKTAGTTRTKGLHQTGTQTLEGRKMDLRMKAELPGKRTSATGKTYYEYRVNRTDMPTERLDFDKNFHRVYGPDDPKLSSLSDLKQEIKTNKLDLEFYKERREHCKRFDAKAEAKKFDKWVGQTKERLEVLEKELNERKAKKTPAKKTSSGTSKKTAEQLKAELYSTRIMLIKDKHELGRLYELLHNHEVEKARWERMGDKRRVQYNENLIKENKANILKYETKIIPTLEKEIAKLENEKKALEEKKTSGTPAKKASSGTASASKSSAKKKQVKKTRKTSKTQKTLF